MPKNTLQFKVHGEEGKTVEISLRVSVIENGYVIKAGGPPFFCADERTLRETVDDALARFLKEVSKT